MVQAISPYLNISSIRKTVFENVINKLTIATTIASASTFIYLSSNGLTQAFASESPNSNFRITESSNPLDSSLAADSTSAADLGAPLTPNCSLESASSPVITLPDQLPAPPATLNPDNNNNQPLPVTTLPDAAENCVQPDQSGESIGGPSLRDTEFRHIEDTINNHDLSSPDRSCSHANQTNQAILFCAPLQGSWQVGK